MTENLTLSKTSPAFPDYLDFQALRAIGLSRVQQLSSQIWTDYNLHDPGITILEVLCYAVTDLGYRTNLDIQDLLALNPADPDRQENNFFTPNAVLTNNPLTVMDWRKRLIDIPGVRNAWLEKVTEVGDDLSEATIADLLAHEGDAPTTLVQPTIYANCVTGQLQLGRPDLPDRAVHRLNPRGLYDVCLDLEPAARKDACGEVQRPIDGILAEVKAVLCRYRTLCEDFRHIRVLGEEAIALCADIELAGNADPNEVLVEIYTAVQAFLAPRPTFYTLQELLARGHSPSDIFAGRPAAALTPEDTDYPSHGFLDTAELAALTLPTHLHVSDVYQVIMDVPGVAAIKKLSLINYINGLRQSTGEPWCLPLTAKHRPVLGIDQSTITFFKGDLPFKANAAIVRQRYHEQQAAYIKARKDPYELDLAVPRGTYLDVADHYSIHHDFPLVYGLGEDGLPTTTPALRKAQAKQMKAYLVFFDQLLANYLAQLRHLRDLFSWETEGDRAPTDTRPDRRRTYFAQGLANIPGGDEILRNFYRFAGSDLPGEPPIDYPTYLDFITEDADTYETRRSQFLDHLLARFAETFTDYVLLNYRLNEGRRATAEILDDKARFLQEYPVLGRDRSRAFNYCLCHDIWDSANVSGFKQRVARLLGMTDFRRRNLSPYRVAAGEGGVTLALFAAADGAEPPAPAPDAEELDAIASPAISVESPTNSPDASAPTGDEPTPSALTLTPQRFHSMGISADRDIDRDRPALLATALQPRHYRRFVVHPAQVPEGKTLAELTRHGYGIVDDQGHLWIERRDRFLTAADRDRDLHRWLTRVRGHQNSFWVEAATECFFVEIRDPHGEAVWLAGIHGVEHEADGIAQQAQILAQGRDRDAYVLTETAIDGAPAFSFELRSGDRDLATHPHHYATARERDLRFDGLRYALITPAPVAAIAGEAGTYQATLLGRDGEPLLVTVQSYATHALAEAAYQRLLHLAADPVYFQILNGLGGAQPYGFVLVDRRGRPYATHPGRYATACQRDLAIRTLINRVNRDLNLHFPPQDEGVVIELRDQAGTSLLRGDIRYDTDADAAIAAEPLLALARAAAHYQPLDEGEGEYPYGFALVAGDTRLATHPARYATVSERDQAIEAVVSAVLQDELTYTIDGEAGRFTVGLVDVLAAPETDAADADLPLLLISAAEYPDADAARAAFDRLIPLGADRAAYHPLDTLPAPNPYGFELRDTAGTVVAHHRTATGEPIGYGTSAERQAAIAKVHTYLAQVAAQGIITNPEGAFSLEIADNHGAVVWQGMRSLPSEAAAQAEIDRIHALAADRDRYTLLDTTVGGCGYGFALTDETGTAIARHPRDYPSPTARDAALERLRLSFGGLSALVSSEPSPSDDPSDPEAADAPVTYRFVLPARHFCAFHACTAEQRSRYQTGSLLHPPPETTFATAAEAEAALVAAIAQAADFDNFEEIYDNAAVRDNPHAHPFSFVLRESDTGAIAAVSGRPYRDRAELRSVMEFLHGLALGFTFTHRTPGTPCGHYFYLAVPLAASDTEADISAPLRSVQRYPSDTQAWEAAAEFAPNLRHLSRYVPLAEAGEPAAGLGITDAVGTVQVAIATPLDPLAAFTALNGMEDWLAIAPVASESPDEPGYQFQLIEPGTDDAPAIPWLQGQHRFPDEATARQAVYREVLGCIFDADAIAPYDTPSGYGFHIVAAVASEAPSEPSPSEPSPPAPIVVAIHPQPEDPSAYRLYATPAARDRAIAQLRLRLQTVRLHLDAHPMTGWRGHIVGSADERLLQGTDPFDTEAEAWAHGNALIELAQNPERLRRIDDADGSCLYRWELTTASGDRIVGVPTEQYASAAARDAALDVLRDRLNDEGFHVLEHILLRPRQVLPPPRPCPPDGDPVDVGAIAPPELEALLPISLKAADCDPEVPLCRSHYDPYSFWISIVLPYWPERFRDMNFRRFVERTLRLEAPAHVALKICWIDVEQMRQFDLAYHAWLTQFSLDACAGAACDLPGSLNALIEVWSHLKNVYPVGTLHDCEASGPDDNPIILDQTALGTAHG